MAIASKMNIAEKLEWGRFVSPLSDRKSIPYNWYKFNHRFGSELVAEIFSKFGLSKGDVVFDPFCGGGTTLIKARFEGYNAVGLDISPFSVFLTNALTKTYDPKKLKRALKNISHEVNPNVEIPDVAILDKSFSENTLEYIFSLRDSICRLRLSNREFFLFSLMSILNDLSKAKKSGGFLRLTDQRKVSKATVKKKFLETSFKYIDDISSFDYGDASVRAVLGDARNYPEEVKKTEYDAILTSPPYPNRHDYTRIYGLELLVGFIKDNKSLKSLRYDTLRSHVEAKKRFDVTDYIMPTLLKEKVDALKLKELNNSQILATIKGYFEDMYLCLKEMHSVLKKDKYIGLVVSNVRFAGVMIPVDELLAEIGEQVGLTTENIYVLRYRGNSSQQMHKYKREPTRESLVVWKK